MITMQNMAPLMFGSLVVVMLIQFGVALTRAGQSLNEFAMVFAQLLANLMGGLVQDAIARLAVPEDGPGISPAMQQDETPASDRTAEALQRAEALIDVDLLRQMVAEMIRHELQGPLGERITRNVRKLVRREINRALENRDIDQI